MTHRSRRGVGGRCAAAACRCPLRSQPRRGTLDRV
jgi:hypothetical protein